MRLGEADKSFDEGTVVRDKCLDTGSEGFDSKNVRSIGTGGQREAVWIVQCLQ